MISKKTHYALKALLLLAKHSDMAGPDAPVLISTLSEKGQIPQKFLESILLELQRFGVLRSKKGKGGGYFLAKPGSSIPVGDVIRKLEGPLALLPCVSHLYYQRCDGCEEPYCSLRVLFKEVRDHTAELLDSTTLAMLCDTESKLRLTPQDPSVPMYFI